MTYEDIVYSVRRMFENADARRVHEHIAIQVNVLGEGAGIFYVEVAERHVCVEPYDYYDHDCLLIADSQIIKELCEKKRSIKKAIEEGSVKFEGDQRKWNLCLTQIKLR